MTRTIIETQGLTRYFTVKKETVHAVRGLDLAINEGEMIAVLGPNGAGKSTTLRMLTTLLAPTAGNAQVAGFDIVKQRRQVRQHIGYIGQGNGAAHNQLGRDELIIQGRAYGLSKAAAKQRAGELIEALELSAVADRDVSSLSGGQRRRLDIAMGLIHTPPLLFLDEPSTGLDPQNRANLLEQLRKLRAAHGTTMVLTTHYLDEADAMAERVIVIDHGKVIADDTAPRLKAELAGDRIELTVIDEANAQAAAQRITQLDPGAWLKAVGNTVTLRTKGGPELAPVLLRDLDQHDITVAGIEVVRPTLDDVFLALTGRSLREETNTLETTEAGETK